MALVSQYPFATASALLSYALLALLWWPPIANYLRALLDLGLTTSQHHVPGLDAVRGLAALHVAVGHLWYFTYTATYPVQLDLPFVQWGTKSVPIFVMLSGFLIFRSVLAIGSLQDLRTYAQRRLLRIYPCYLFAVLLAMALGQTLGVRGDIGNLQFALTELFMLGALQAPYFANPVVWSLHVELLFYALMPIFVLLVGKRNLLPALLIAAIVLTAADGGLVRSFALWKYFLFGALASQVQLTTPAKPRIAALLLASGVALLALDFGGPVYDWAGAISIGPKSDEGFTLGLGLATGLILYAMPTAARVGAVLDTFPLRLLGNVSYSLFLLHPFYIVASFPELKLQLGQGQLDQWRTYEVMPTWFFLFVYVPGLLIWAVLAYCAIERPAIRYGRRQTSLSGGVAARPVPSAG